MGFYSVSTGEQINFTFYSYLKMYTNVTSKSLKFVLFTIQNFFIDSNTMRVIMRRT